MSKEATKLDIAQLEVGHHVRLPMSWRDHPFVFNSFKIKDAQQLALIRKLDLKFVYVDLKRSTVGEETVEQIDVSDETLQKAQDALAATKRAQIERQKEHRRSLSKTAKQYSDNLARARSLSSKIKVRPEDGVKVATDMIKGMIEDVINSGGIELHLMSDGEHKDQVHHHGLNVTVLSLMLGRKMGLTATEIETLGVGALLHDFGKSRLPAKLLNNKPSNTVEMKAYRSHPMLARELIAENSPLPWQAVAIIKQHHEMLDGSGYPQGLSEQQIDPLAQIVAVVNEYDNLVHERDPRKRCTPNTALGWLFKHKSKKLNSKALQQFIRMMGIYPPGSVVQLDNGQYGLVMSIDEANLLSPNVMVYDPAVPSQEAAIFNIGEEGLKVSKSLPPDALSKGAFEYLCPRDRINYYFDGKR